MMMRGWVVGVVLVLVLVATRTPTLARTPSSAHGKAASKVDARQTSTTRTSSRRDSRKKAKKPSRKGSRRVAAAKQPGPRVKTTAKPLVTVAKFQVDGRVKYGPDRMPPGFAWPPTEQMRTTSQACERELDRMGIEWKPGPVTGKVTDPVIVPSMQLGGIAYTAIYSKGPIVLDCQLVRDLVLLGPELHALGVREVQFGSTYRNTMARSHGKTQDFLSRHALGLAMDIRSFVDENGRVAVVELDYLKGDPLLHGIEDLINGSTRWRQVLTPANDPISHDDHFHIEASADFTGFR